MPSTTLPAALLETKLRKIYLKLREESRRGVFESELDCYVYECTEFDDPASFYLYDGGDPGTARKVKYREAVANLYSLVVFLNQHRREWADQHAIELLACRNLIYEISDHFLQVPPQLGAYMRSFAYQLRDQIRNNGLQAEASRLVLGPSADGSDEYTRAKVLKTQLTAALCGVNFLYRTHSPELHQRALNIVHDIEGFVREQLPKEYTPDRPSFGLMGMAAFLRGRLLSALGDYPGAQAAFAESSDAYWLRLEQKSQFFMNGYIKEEQFEETKRVTLRRASVVSALGIGYVSFINGRIARALAALSTSRLVLKNNVGAVHGAFVDILYFACRRAEKSSDRKTMDEVVAGLKNCRATLERLVPGTHYFHRAGLELATALHSRAKLSYKADDRPNERLHDHQWALELLHAAIGYAEKVEDERFRNPRLLAEALVLRSYIRLWPPIRDDQDQHLKVTQSREDAERSSSVASGNTRTRCEALIALGIAHFREYKIDRNNLDRAGQDNRLQNAQRYFREALAVNGKRNPRIEGVCYLNLAKVCSLDHGSVALAHDYFDWWKQVRDRVEHAYCHELADEVSRRLSSEGPLLVVNAEASMNHTEWEIKLKDHLVNSLLRKLAEKTRGDNIDDAHLRRLIEDGLMQDLGYGRTKALGLAKSREQALVARLQTLRHR
jgi:tetratricopeptide (TPR) repeat protein